MGNNLSASCRSLLAIMACLFVTGSQAQQQFQGLCSRVKIEIAQELTTERIGFEALLKVTNNDSEDPINQFSAALYFTDVETGEDATDRFFIQPPEMSSINRVDGTGVIGPTKQAVVTWFIIPKITAGGTDPRGREYSVGCNLAGYIRGEKIPDDILYAVEDVITVKPEPQLEITYFQPRDVTGDDPFTPEVESPIPFTLGVLVKNAGYGSAKSVKIDSKQPKIVENENGLLLIARLLGARVQDSELSTASLIVDIGDIVPGAVRKGAWDMITSLSGEFVEFRASYRHADELGGEETSVITSINAYFIAREVLNDEPGRDRIMDFLADVDEDDDHIPDTLFETDGAQLPVNHLTQVTVEPLSGNQTVVQLLADREGWGYLRLDDPAQALLRLASVVRNDGKVLNLQNVWTNIRYRKTDNFKLTYLNLFDRVESGVTYTYTVTYDTDFSDTVAPVTSVRFSGEVAQVGNSFYVSPETQIYFISNDQSPVSIQYRLDGGDFRPALPFRIQQPGSYQLDYFASDTSNNSETVQNTTIILQGTDAPVSLALSEAEVFPADFLTIRPETSTVSAAIPANPTGVDARLTIHRGVVAWPTVSGLPISPTRDSSATLTVGGRFVDYYRYRVNGQPWSNERPIAESLELAGLSGAVTLDILARHSNGTYLNDQDALTLSWTVDAGAPQLTATGVPATPSNGPASAQISLAGAASTLFRWSLGENSYFRPEQLFSVPIDLPELPVGDVVLRIITNTGDVWPDPEEPDPLSRIQWTYDPHYSFDLSSLTTVRTAQLGNLAGSVLSYTWDGRDDAGVAQVPGTYSVLLTLTDGLGNISYATTLIDVIGLTDDRITIAEEAAAPENLDTAGNWAVWQQSAQGVSNIFARNLNDGSDAVALTDEDTFDQENPATDGTYVVWQARLANGATDIRLRPLAQATETAVSESTDLTETNPVVEWPWVVYQVKPVASPSTPWQLEAWNADSNARFAVSVGPGDQLQPAIHGGRVVWEDHRDVGPGEIYFADLEAGTVRRITENTSGQAGAALFADQIVWQDNRDGQVDIWGYDLRTGSITQITDSPFNETRPAVAGNWLIYQEDSLGALSENIVLHDLTSGRAVALTRAERMHVIGGIGTRSVSWLEQSSVGGSDRVVAGELPALQSLARRHNAVVVSQELASRFTSAFQLLNAWKDDGGPQSLTRFDSFQPLTTRVAEIIDGNPAGDDFPIVSGSFVWADFDQFGLLDLGSADSGPINLDNGLNVVNYTGFPTGFSAYTLIAQIGTDKLSGIRCFDAADGFWRSVEIATDGSLIGPDFHIPRTCTLLLESLQQTAVTPAR